MMKKFFMVLFGMLVLCRADAATYIAFDENVLGAVFAEYFANQDDQLAALDKYRTFLKRNRGAGISPEQLWQVCKAGGLDIKATQGKDTCNKIASGLTQSAERFFRVCASDKGKTGGKERCVDDVFNGALEGIQVPKSIGVSLAQEYARVKYNDEIVCRDPFVKIGVADYSLLCKSSKEKIFYEFKFDDLEETKDYAIYSSIVSALCRIHDVKYLPAGSSTSYTGGYTGGMYSGGTKTDVWSDACDTTDEKKCEKISKSARRFAFGAQIGKYMDKNACLVEHGEQVLRTMFGIDNMYFRKNAVQLNMKTHLKDQIKQFVISEIAPERLVSFDCDDAYWPYYDRSGSVVKIDDVLTCYVNDYPIDFVFDDLSEAKKIMSKAGEQAMTCIVQGGTYDGKHCLHLDQVACDKLKAVSDQTCPECKDAYWDDKDEVCKLPASAKGTNLKKGIVISGIVAGAVAGVAITLGTGGTTAGALVIVAVETTGAAIELGAQVKINQAADDFLLQSNNCNEAECAEELIGKHLQRLANMTNDLSQQEENAIDQEMVRLINLVPDDSDLITDILENGISLADREKGFFDLDSWEPEQIWRAVGIAMQLASVVTSVGKWVKTGGKVTQTLDEATDVMRMKLTRAQAKSLDDLDDLISTLTQQRQVAGLGKSKADDLWAALKTAQQKRTTLLNNLGNPSDELLALLKQEAYLEDGLGAARSSLDDIIRQQDNLFMTNKNGQQVLRPGKTKYDVMAVTRNHDAVVTKIDELETGLKSVDEQINAMLGIGRQADVVDDVTNVPGRVLFDNGISNNAVAAKALIAEGKNQTRKEFDHLPVVNVVESERLLSAQAIETKPELAAIPVGAVMGPSMAMLPELAPQSVGSIPEKPQAVPEKPVKPQTTPVKPVKPQTMPVKPVKPQTTPDVPEKPQAAPDVPENSKIVQTIGANFSSDLRTSKSETGKSTYQVNKKQNTGLIAGAAVAGAIGAGFLIGGLVGQDKNNDVHEKTGQDMQFGDDLNRLMQNANGAFGVVGTDALKLVPLDTTIGTRAPIVLIDGNAVAVVDFDGHRLPYWVNPVSGRWEPLLGIGEQGKWFNTYTNPINTGISFIDEITKQMNASLSPVTVLQIVKSNTVGGRFPNAASAAYDVINAEFPNGVVQTINEFNSASGRLLYNNNYNRIKNLFNTAQNWAVFI